MTATLVSSGKRAGFKAASVTNLSVPLEPVKRPFKLYLADDFLNFYKPSVSYRGLSQLTSAFVEFLINFPSASRTVRLITQSFIVLYRTAFVPLIFKDH